MSETLVRPPPVTKLQRPRLGVLGAGWIGCHRARAILENQTADVVAVADPSADAVAQLLKIAPDAKRARTFEELLDNDVDGILIATPTAMHAEQTILALDRGVAVFCQKPLGRTAAEVQAVVSAARAADRLLAVDLSYRFTEGMRQIRGLIERGELGRVFAADLVFHNAYGPDKPWFYDLARSGGGCVMDLGIHLVDLALWALDFPEVSDVFSTLLSGGEMLARNSNQVEDYAAASLRLANGAAVQLSCSWRLSAGCDAIIGAAFYGTKGGAALRNVEGSFYDFRAERYTGTARQMLSDPADAWFGRAAVDWAKRLAAGERFDAGADRLVDVARVLDRICSRG